MELSQHTQSHVNHVVKGAGQRKTSAEACTRNGRRSGCGAEERPASVNGRRGTAGPRRSEALSAVPGSVSSLWRAHSGMVPGEAPLCRKVVEREVEPTHPDRQSADELSRAPRGMATAGAMLSPSEASSHAHAAAEAGAEWPAEAEVAAGEGGIELVEACGTERRRTAETLPPAMTVAVGASGQDCRPRVGDMGGPRPCLVTGKVKGGSAASAAASTRYVSVVADAVPGSGAASPGGTPLLLATVPRRGDDCNSTRTTGVGSTGAPGGRGSALERLKSSSGARANAADVLVLKGGGLGTLPKRRRSSSVEWMSTETGPWGRHGFCCALERTPPPSLAERVWARSVGPLRATWKGGRSALPWTPWLAERGATPASGDAGTRAPTDAPTPTARGGSSALNGASGRGTAVGSWGGSSARAAASVMSSVAAVTEAVVVAHSLRPGGGESGRGAGRAGLSARTRRGELLSGSAAAAVIIVSISSSAHSAAASAAKKSPSTAGALCRRSTHRPPPSTVSSLSFALSHERVCEKFSSSSSSPLPASSASQWPLPSSLTSGQARPPVRRGECSMMPHGHRRGPRRGRTFFLAAVAGFADGAGAGGAAGKGAANEGAGGLHVGDTRGGGSEEAGGEVPPLGASGGGAPGRASVPEAAGPLGDAGGVPSAAGG